MNIQELRKLIDSQIRTRDQFFFFVCRLSDNKEILDFSLGERCCIVYHLDNTTQAYSYF